MVLWPIHLDCTLTTANKGFFLRFAFLVFWIYELEADKQQLMDVTDDCCYAVYAAGIER
jgi:hypothetical protein